MANKLHEDAVATLLFLNPGMKTRGFWSKVVAAIAGDEDEDLIMPQGMRRILPDAYEIIPPTESSVGEVRVYEVDVWTRQLQSAEKWIDAWLDFDASMNWELRMFSVIPYGIGAGMVLEQNMFLLWYGGIRERRERWERGRRRNTSAEEQKRDREANEEYTRKFRASLLKPDGAEAAGESRD